MNTIQYKHFSPVTYSSSRDDNPRIFGAMIGAVLFCILTFFTLEHSSTHESELARYHLGEIALELHEHRSQELLAPSSPAERGALQARVQIQVYEEQRGLVDRAAETADVFGIFTDDPTIDISTDDISLSTVEGDDYGLLERAHLQGLSAQEVSFYQNQDAPEQGWLLRNFSLFWLFLLLAVPFLHPELLFLVAWPVSALLSLGSSAKTGAQNKHQARKKMAQRAQLPLNDPLRICLDGIDAANAALKSSSLSVTERSEIEAELRQLEQKRITLEAERDNDSSVVDDLRDRNKRIDAMTAPVEEVLSNPWDDE